MKKKILSVIIALFLVVSSVFALTACKNNETNNNQEEVIIGDNTNNNSNNSGNGSNSNSDSGNGSNSNNDSGNGQSDDDDSNQELEDNGSGNGSDSGSGNGSGNGTGDDSGNGSNNDQVNAQALAMVSEKVVALLANSTVRASVDKSLGLRGEKAESDDTEEYELLLADGSAYMNMGDMFLSQEFAVTEEDTTQALAVVLGFAQEYNLLAVDAQVTSNGYEVVVTLDLAETLNNVIDFLYENLDTSIYDLLAPTGLVENLNLGLVDLFDGLTSETTIEDLVNMVGQALGYDGAAEIVAENFDDIKEYIMEADIIPMDISALEWDDIKSSNLGVAVALVQSLLDIDAPEYDTTPAFNVQLADLVTGSLVAVLSDTTLGEALELAESTILEIAELTRDELYYAIYGPSGAGYMDLSANSLIPDWNGNPPTPDQPVVFTLLERTKIAEASVSLKFTFDPTANLTAINFAANFDAYSEAGEQNIGLIDAEFNTEFTFENVGDTEAPDAEEEAVVALEDFVTMVLSEMFASDPGDPGYDDPNTDYPECLGSINITTDGFIGYLAAAYKAVNGTADYLNDLDVLDPGYHVELLQLPYQPEMEFSADNGYAMILEFYVANYNDDNMCVSMLDYSIADNVDVHYYSCPNFPVDLSDENCFDNATTTFDGINLPAGNSAYIYVIVTVDDLAKLAYYTPNLTFTISNAEAE